MKKSKAQLKKERDTIKAQVVQEVTNLCEGWALRSLMATSTTETMDMLFLWFAFAWGGRIFKHKELQADTLSELVAEEIDERGSLTEKERFRQCESLSSVWRSWEFLANKSFTIGDAKMHWYFTTRTLHPSSQSGGEK